VWCGSAGCCFLICTDYTGNPEFIEKCCLLTVFALQRTADIYQQSSCVSNWSGYKEEMAASEFTASCRIFLSWCSTWLISYYQSGWIKGMYSPYLAVWFSLMFVDWHSSRAKYHVLYHHMATIYQPAPQQAEDFAVLLNVLCYVM